jgi:hypothetical protein
MDVATSDDWYIERTKRMKMESDKQRGFSWIWKVRAGDVLRSRSGTLRVVRRVSQGRSRVHVFFAIRHCSWTHRCYTLLERNDLIQNGYRPTGAHVNLRKRIDRQIARELDGDRLKPKLDCCKVRGIA